MKYHDRENKEIVQYILAWGLIPLAYLAWCFSTIAYKNCSFMVLSCIAGILAAMLYYILEKNMLNCNKFKDEILVLNICIFIAGCIFGVSVFSFLNDNSRDIHNRISSDLFKDLTGDE